MPAKFIQTTIKSMHEKKSYYIHTTYSKNNALSSVHQFVLKKFVKWNMWPYHLDDLPHQKLYWGSCHESDLKAKKMKEYSYFYEYNITEVTNFCTFIIIGLIVNFFSLFCLSKIYCQNSRSSNDERERSFRVHCRWGTILHSASLTLLYSS